MSSGDNYAANNLPTTQYINAHIISQANTKFASCVNEGALAAIGTAAAESMKKDTSTLDAISNAWNEGVNLQLDCLSQNPFAALSPNYGGIVGPGDIGRVPPWLQLFQP